MLLAHMHVLWKFTIEPSVPGMWIRTRKVQIAHLMNSSMEDGIASTLSRVRPSLMTIYVLFDFFKHKEEINRVS